IVRYRARRGEVWRWYWRRWRAKLWQTWLLGGGAAYAAVLFVFASEHPFETRDLLTALWAPAVLWMFLALFPQAMFKSAERTLEIGPGGIDSCIGVKRAHRDWREIDTITETNGVIALRVRRTGNAFLVPDRAFESGEQRTEFLRQAREWLAAT